MLGDGQKLYVCIAEVFDIGDQLFGQFAVSRFFVRAELDGGQDVPVPLPLGRDGGLDPDLSQAAQEEVSAWRDTGEYPFPVTPEPLAARIAGADLDSVCGGRGICGRCRIEPSYGDFPKWNVSVAADALGGWSDNELRFDEKKGQ